ncbi:PKD domain-containing protein [Ochrovirga pacifica]|uniref:PKD domain-containing protein n=1 Tax=Ochrovirga pacifica TaxID=1042376 RepID=UPI000255A4F8|nr:PKD domain-containing protein [Ochrovirga pacifica]
MKKIFLLFLCIFSLISCEDDTDFSTEHTSFLWYTSNGFEEADYTIGIEDYITLLDLSKNTKTHLFSIPKTAKFIEGDLNRGITDYTPYLVDTDENTSTQTKINVIFTEPGLQTISLKNTYSKQTEGATLVENAWIAEQNFTVDVFDRLNPKGSVSKYNYTDPDNPILETVLTFDENTTSLIEEKDTWATTTIEAGEELVFTDASTTGRPTSRTWYAKGGKPETSSKEEASIRYNKPGTYTTSIESKRSGSEVPAYTTEKLIPLVIQVIPSTKPFVQSGTVTLENNIIRFGVTGEVESAIAQASKFTVHVTNVAANFDANIPISTVQISPDDPSIIQLELAETVYNTDTIELSFTDGNIVSVDSRTLENFGPLTVVNAPGTNVFVNDVAGFENENSNWKKGYCQNYFIGNGNGTAEAPIFSRTSEQVYQGEASMKFSMDGIKNISFIGLDLSKPNGIEAGTYLISYWVYIVDHGNDEINNLKTFRTQIKSGSNLVQEEIWSLEGLEKNKWVKIEKTITVADIASGTKIDIRFQTADNPDVSGLQTIYFDSYSWIKQQPRP